MAPAFRRDPRFLKPNPPPKKHTFHHSLSVDRKATEASKLKKDKKGVGEAFQFLGVWDLGFKVFGFFWGLAGLGCSWFRASRCLVLELVGMLLWFTAWVSRTGTA